jgi:hypothetical protein
MEKNYEGLYGKAIDQNPKLAECTKDSLEGALLQTMHLWLELGRQVNLIPRWNDEKNALECVFSLEQEGRLELQRRVKGAVEVFDRLSWEKMENLLVLYAKILANFPRQVAGDPMSEEFLKKLVEGARELAPFIFGVDGSDSKNGLFKPDEVAALEKAFAN